MQDRVARRIWTASGKLSAYIQIASLKRLFSQNWIAVSTATACLALLVTMIATSPSRSEEHTSELQSRGHLVCRLLLEKKKTMHQPEVLAVVASGTYR